MSQRSLRNRILLRREIKQDIRDLIAQDPDGDPLDNERVEFLAEKYGMDLAGILAILKELMPFILMIVELFKK